MSWRMAAWILSLIAYYAEYLLDPHHHLPAYTLLLLGCPVTPGEERVVIVADDLTPQGVPHAVYALLAQNLHEAGDTPALYFF
jgi:N-acetylglucosamine-6-phosphate deacetylase